MTTGERGVGSCDNRREIRSNDNMREELEVMTTRERMSLFKAEFEYAAFIVVI